jgi:UDPglucose--hexose-1-phosphate uridylyltransferase
MHKRELRKADGRSLVLYSRWPISDAIVAPGLPESASNRVPPNPHLRWHPFRAEWVAYATGRQHRTFLPDANPLAATTDSARPTELPAGNYDVAVFENLFPALVAEAHDPPEELVETRPAQGSAEVMVFTQDPSASLGTLPLEHLELIIEVWADRYRVLGARDDVQYVYPFENRGVEVGVTLQHPHGQIFAYPFVPPIPARELEQQRQYFERHGRGLLEDLIARELTDGRRIVCESGESVAFLPAWARYSYEVWVAPKSAVPSLADFSPKGRSDFARVLKTVLLKFDALWHRPFPYVMAMHQAPTDGRLHPEAHLHIEFYPAYRMEGRLKYLAGSELGAGMFTADTIPEEKARELRDVAVDVV